MAIPTIEWDEGNPPGQQVKSLGAQRIRELKTQLREIFSVDHNMSSAGNGTTWGYHKKATLYIRTADSLPSENTGCLFSKDVTWNDVTKAELFWVDENDNIAQLTSQGNFVGGIPKEIRMWSGTLANIPDTWVLCDGNNGTPNLIGRFVRCVRTNTTNPYYPGDGADTVTLTSSNFPRHTHLVQNASHTHYFKDWDGSSLHGSGAVATNLQYTDSYIDSPNSVEAVTHTHILKHTGSGVEINNLPAYLELAFIMKEAS